MAYVPGFGQDVFISYAQVDNEPLNVNGRQVRWVSYLKEQLQRRVDQKLGRKGASKIWMDLDDLAGNESVTPAIDNAISSTAALVAVLSDGYLNSVWCQKEIRSFVESAGADGRLFVVHLADIPLDDRPEPIRDLIGFDFFDESLKVELDPYSAEYSRVLLKLREKLAAKLSEMKQSPARPQSDSAPSSPAVFLCEGTHDLDYDRDALATYVEKLGYRVLPAKLYPRGRDEFQERLDQDLAESKLVVQLLGQYGTRRTEELPDGYEGLQLERAKAADVPVLRAYMRDTVNFERVRDPSHRDFLKASDVMALDLEEFKTALRVKLDELALRESKPIGPEMADHPVLIHVIGGDLQSAFRIRDRLIAQNLPYEIVDEEEPLEELARIRDYSGLVLVYGEQTSGKWIKQRMRTFMDLRLSKQPLEPACVLYFDPAQKRRELLASPPPFFRMIDSNSGDPQFEQLVEELKLQEARS